MTSETLTDLFFTRYPEEQRHSQAVSRLAQALGKTLGLDENAQRNLTDAAKLHDIGKLAMDRNLLRMPGRLTEEEWTQVREHPLVSYRILNSFPETLDLTDIVLTHHEHWDGNGYPKGLQSKEINLLSRIIAVAESYDAMTNDTPCRVALNEEQAQQQLKSGSGSQFDPAVVSAFFELL